MEQWKTVVCNGEVFENYEVSTEGRVRSLNYNHSGQIKVLKPQENTSGYLQVQLYKNKSKKQFYVHRLVAIMFIPNPNNLQEINHINENKHDNRLENLEWISRKANIEHGTRTERMAQARERKIKCIETGIIYNSIKQASEKTGLDESGIAKACKGTYKTCGKLHWEFVE